MVEESTKFSVIIPAAGRSRRFAEAGGKANKLEQELRRKPVFLRSIELFANRPEVAGTILAVHPEEVDAYKFRWGDKLGFLGVRIVAGGKAERWETVLHAIEQIDAEATHIAVHDAARPVAAAAMIDRAFEAARQYAAVIPGVRVSETLKRTEREADRPAEAADPLDAILGSAGKPAFEAYRVTETMPRDNLWRIQTPQVFRRDLLVRAYDRIRHGEADGASITDDAGLIEAMGESVHVVPGDPLNVKITRPEDMAFAEAVIAMREGGPAAGDAPKRKFPTWAEMDED